MKRFLILTLTMVMVLSAVVGSYAFAEDAMDASNIEGSLIVGTATSTGTYYYVAAAIGNAIMNNSKLDILVQATNGSMENIAFAQSGDIDVGMANSDAIFSANQGTMSYADVGKQDILQVASLYYSCLHMFTRADSDIQSVADLKGKRVNIGAIGTTYLFINKAILAYYGIDWEKDIEAFYLDTGESATKLADGDIDASFITGGAPITGIESATTSISFKYLSLDEECIQSIVSEYPFIVDYTMQAGTYKDQDYDVKTIGYMTCFFASSKASDDLIYAFVKMMAETVDLYRDTNNSSRQISVEGMATPFIQWHPGALRYYIEAGLLTE